MKIFIMQFFHQLVTTQTQRIYEVFYSHFSLKVLKIKSKGEAKLFVFINLLHLIEILCIY